MDLKANVSHGAANSIGVVYPYADSISNKQDRSQKDDYLSMANIMLTSQQKQGNDGQTFLGETLGSAIVDSGVSATICGPKCYDCFLETIPVLKTKKNVSKCLRGPENLEVQRQKLKSLSRATVPCVIASIDVSIFTDVMDSDITLLLSKDVMKRAKPYLNFENVTVLGKKVSL